MEQVSLNIKQTVELTPIAPFNFDATFYKPDHFPSGDNDWKHSVRWQTMLWEGKYLGLVFRDRGTINQPKIDLTVWSTQYLDQNFVDRLIAEIEYRCNLQFDLSEFYRKYENDPNIDYVIKSQYGMRPANYRSLYEYLIITIMLQNCSVMRSISMLEIMFKQYGKTLSFDGKILYGFWDYNVIIEVTEQELRDLRIGYRAKAIKRISNSFAKKEVDEMILRTTQTKKQQEELLKLYGVGCASVGYIMFDVFHNMGELNYISPWEQKIYSKLIFDTNPMHPKPVETILCSLDKSFNEYKMLAMHYYWEDAFWKRKMGCNNWLSKL